ncbi:MAG: helix-turn-helix domain-containing protein [Abitibacteriaceae bacterium]|nr:helix-turn-helix domain-containing protein [Abditibacteriaceae bacterium]
MDHLRSHQYFKSGFPLYIAEVRQGPLGEHSHEFFEMVYVRSGRGAHFIDGVPYPIQAGDLYVISPGEQHRYAPLEGSALRMVNILWMPALVEDLLHADSRLDGTLEGAMKLLYVEPVLRRETRFAHRLHLTGSMAYRVEVLLDEMRREQAAAAAGCELLLRHLFCALLVLLSRAYDAQSTVATSNANTRTGISPQQMIVSQAIEFIEEHYAKPIRVADVAAHTALSPSRLAHIFKDCTGRGLIEYLHDFRMARACSALQSSTLSVSTIATEVGYSDLRFFHRVFRRHTGCNPTQYRQHFQTLALTPDLSPTTPL